MSIYGAIKAGFHGMVRALIQDLKGTGIRINTLSPGAVDTPSLQRALGKAAGSEAVDQIVQSMAQRSPLELERRARSARSRCSLRATRQATSMASNCLSMAG